MKLRQNGTGAMTTAKNKAFIGLQHENCYLVWGRMGGLTFGEGNENLVGESLLGGVFFQPGGRE